MEQQDSRHISHQESQISTHNDTLEAAKAQLLRDGILEAVAPLIEGDDSFSNVLYHTLKRVLQRAEYGQLLEVFVQAEMLIAKVKGIAGAGTNPVPTSGSDDTAEQDSSGTVVDRSIDAGSGENYATGPISGNDALREIDASSLTDSELSEALRAQLSDSSSGHETQMAGNEDHFGTVSTESL